MDFLTEVTSVMELTLPSTAEQRSFGFGPGGGGAEGVLSIVPAPEIRVQQTRILDNMEGSGLHTHYATLLTVTCS